MRHLSYLFLISACLFISYSSQFTIDTMTSCTTDNDCSMFGEHYCCTRLYGSRSNKPDLETRTCLDRDLIEKNGGRILF